MRQFKQAELYLQALFLICVIISVVFTTEFFNPVTFITGLILIQLISMIVNAASGPLKWKLNRWRKLHLYGMLAVVLLIIIAFMQSSSARTGDKDDKYSMAGMGTLMIAVIPALLLVIYYFVITWKEWADLKKESALK